jgi:hypothetical protein
LQAVTAHKLPYFQGFHRFFYGDRCFIFVADMQWNRPKDKLPNHKEEVLIRYGGIFNLATYNEHDKVFILRDGSQYGIDKINIQWLRLVTP